MCYFFLLTSSREKANMGSATAVTGIWSIPGRCLIKTGFSTKLNGGKHPTFENNLRFCCFSSFHVVYCHSGVTSEEGRWEEICRCFPGGPISDVLKSFNPTVDCCHPNTVHLKQHQVQQFSFYAANISTAFFFPKEDLSHLKIFHYPEVKYLGF